MSSLGIYTYNDTYYTGTDVQPDMLNIFIKPKNEDIKSWQYRSFLPLATWMGCSPIFSMASGLARIKNAVMKIFEILSNLKTLSEINEHASELWNAFKNLFRGVGEFVPISLITGISTGSVITGISAGVAITISLAIFESARAVIYQYKINDELKDKKNIAGVAMDGKVIFTVELDKIDDILFEDKSPESISNEDRCTIFSAYCLKRLKAWEKKGIKIGMDKLFQQLKEDIFKD